MANVSVADLVAQADDLIVDQLAAAMKAKLKLKRSQGYGGWQTASTYRLWELLEDHILKGDPVDVANFAAMIYAKTQMVKTHG